MNLKQTESSPQDLDDMIFELLDGAITPDRHQKLQGILKHNPAARQRYRDLTRLEDLLEDQMHSAAHPQMSTPQNLIPFDRLARRQRKRIAMWSAATAAAVLLICGVILTVINVSFEPSVATMRYAEHSDYRVTYPEDVDYEAGELVSGAIVELKQGSVELNINSGVVAVVEAPALFKMVDEYTLELKNGNSWFSVSPQGHGFTVKTPQMEVVDLGTEFGVVVDPTTADEQVHVLRGRVQVSSLLKMKDVQTLTTGQACKVSMDGGLETIPVAQDSFLKGLPDGLTYLEWSLDEPTNKAFAATGNMAGLEDVVSSVVRGKIDVVPGRKDRARRFHPNNGFIQTTWPGVDADRPRTISAWVKYPKKPDAIPTGAIIEWGNPDLNAAKWRVTINAGGDAGKVGALRTEFSRGYVIGTTDLRDGEWHHVVSVYDGSGRGDASTIKLYVDGKQEEISEYKVNRVGTIVGRPGADPCLIGRNFRGTIDDVRVYQGAYPEEYIPHLMGE
ncbi:FecR family protein [Rubritalea squalenifaciens DSM 18772]|uniref:FecR family protein n=1 Tax=Rubritalea squalenifaciens DSM 18772 TaxID=1123071 RepID=A0A1M6CSS7_9BACT|nr:LamG-like jellyroll fold domain-containing protein [Rubritalea squalenifaciens]SHI63923.1 FecR family protein [Rubritalea squalenifaciens DSM 18772]